jgi:hypothetical protein
MAPVMVARSTCAVHIRLRVKAENSIPRDRPMNEVLIADVEGVVRCMMITSCANLQPTSRVS